eukprot:CAMPEP_0117433836 /NCGR_PEP_ID=MMETSP0758-20121206/13116_1 /TAXON_ID=63605 /ORGANISM="Percolomonas cosmopolitus, Strain AE-1 (ATCC 50343)" /LENGTH=165 /DNA_ID=CAMNT_0005224735 /DNA_START=172 /DNA_END=665 /DNA_ORIENTATION=-
MEQHEKSINDLQLKEEPHDDQETKPLKNVQIHVVVVVLVDEAMSPQLMKPMNQDAAFPPNPNDDIIRTDTHYEEEENDKPTTPRQAKSPKQLSRKHKELARIYAVGGSIPEYKKTPPRVEAYRQGFMTSPPEAISPKMKRALQQEKQKKKKPPADESIPETARAT